MTIWLAPASRVIALAALGLSGTVATAAAADDALRGSLAATPAPPVIELPSRQGERVLPVAKVLPQGAENPSATSVRGAAPSTDTADPYAPLGLRFGSFILLPSVEITAGYSSNASRSAGGKPGGVLTIEPEAILRSDWSSHAAELTLRGSYEKAAGSSEPNKFAMSADGKSHVDISQDMAAEFTAAYKLDHQSVTDPAFPAGADDPPAVHMFGGSAALVRGIGPAEFTFKVDASRAVYDDATAAGLVIDQGDRTNTVGEARLRAGYRVSPAVMPFAEAGVGRRLFDRQVNGAGYAPSGGIYFVRSGFAFDDGPVLTGEGAFGWRWETREDARLPSLAGLTFDGSLMWSPTRLVVATLNAATVFSPQPDPTSAGSIKYDLSADFAYLARANLTLHGLADVAAERFDNGGMDWKYVLGVSAEWRFNRMLGLTAKYLHEWTDDADPARNYAADTLSVGLRLQR